MKNASIIISLLLFFCFTKLNAQSSKFGNYDVEPVGVSMSSETIMGIKAIRAIKDSTVKAVDEPTFIRINGGDFKNGTIEVKVLSRLLSNAPDYARGFIGVAFRINASNTKYESIYIRPVNARVVNQVRRNHSIQYYSYPDYKFDRLRKESPERYESYADMEMNKWIVMKILVRDAQAKLYINNNEQSVLIVNDLKHGVNNSGAIGLWVEIGTEGYFADLKINKQD